MSLREDVRAYRRELIRAALLRHGGNRARAARELGVSAEYIYRTCARFDFGIPAKTGRPRKGT